MLTAGPGRAPSVGSSCVAGAAAEKASVALAENTDLDGARWDWDCASFGRRMMVYRVVPVCPGCQDP